MTIQVSTHTVERHVGPEDYDGSIAYQCVDCGLYGIKVVEFERYSCDGNQCIEDDGSPVTDSAE